jgi:uncharacterized protein (TIGR02452 family)
MTDVTFDHVGWIKNFQIASSKREGFRELRVEIFQSTVKLVQSNGYNLDNRYIKIDNENIFTEYFIMPEQLPFNKCYETKFSVINADCIEAAKILLDAGQNPCILNLASRQNPGGGVLGGAGAQEENIFRRTNLFMSLYQFAHYAEDYGIKKSNHSYPLDRNTGGIYSNNITIFRGSEKNGYRLLKKPFTASFVTVPAINHPELIKNDNYYIAESLIEPTKEKIRTILRIVGKYNHDCLILGAFGCGAFTNPPNHMAELFKGVFFEEEFNGRFKNIVFAILEDHNSGKEHNPNGNVLPFLEIFDE